MRFAARAALLCALTTAAYAAVPGGAQAFDDELVLGGNVIVQRGLRGLGEIFGRDTYAGYAETFGLPTYLQGGRYRPLALATFALEQSLFGEVTGDGYRALTDPIARADWEEQRMQPASLRLAPIRHAVSLALYLVLLVALLWLLERDLLPETPRVALLATLLFALHPLHVEVVANIKSRDEILSLLFIVIALSAALRHEAGGRRRDFVLAIAAFALALFSKEYAVVLPPLLLVAVHLRRPRPWSALLWRWAPALVAVMAGYALARLRATGLPPSLPLAAQDLLNDPFLPLRLGQAQGSVLATKLAILLHYPRLLLWPHPLSADYSYATFPFRAWGELLPWASVALHLGVVAATVVALRRRHVLAFAGCAYLLFLLPVSNLPFEIGATLGERLAFHASIGFCLALAWVCSTALGARAVVPVALIAALYSARVIARVPDWHDDHTLFLHDVTVVPDSVMCNGNAGGELLHPALVRVRDRHLAQRPLDDEDRAFIREHSDRALPYLLRALALHPRFANGWVNLGLLRWTREELGPAADAWAQAAAILPAHPVLHRYAANFHAFGDAAARAGDLPEAIVEYERATRVAPGERRYLHDLAGARFMDLRFTAARDTFDALLRLGAASDADAPLLDDAARGRAAADGLSRLEAAAQAGAPLEAHRAAVRAFADALSQNAAPAFQRRAAALREDSARR